MVILITGITSGFGRAMAARLSADGHKVYGTYRKVQAPLPGVTYLKADVRSDEDARAAVQAVLDAEGRIDAFISNAGMGIGGLMGLPFQGLYSASKFAIEGYCEALRLEVRGFGINVILIEPGDFATSFTASRRSVPDAEAFEAYKSYRDSLASIEK